MIFGWTDFGNLKYFMYFHHYSVLSYCLLTFLTKKYIHYNYLVFYVGEFASPFLHIKNLMLYKGYKGKLKLPNEILFVFVFTFMRCYIQPIILEGLDKTENMSYIVRLYIWSFM